MIEIEDLPKRCTECFLLRKDLSCVLFELCGRILVEGNPEILSDDECELIRFKISMLNPDNIDNKSLLTF